MRYFEDLFQVVFIALLAPFLLGYMRQIRAKMEGRQGPGIAQMWRDLRKGFHKGNIVPNGTTAVFSVAPFIYFATAILSAAVIPIVFSSPPEDSAIDFFALVGILLIGTVSLVLGGLDTGTAFGGIGASREMTILALSEPTILLSVYALSMRVHSSNLSTIVNKLIQHPLQIILPGNVLSLVALVIVVVAETGRLPIDNPSTHLELTMIHEAMLLEYSGVHLALIEWASAIRLSVLLALTINLFIPFGIGNFPNTLLGLGGGLVAITIKLVVVAGAMAAIEVFIAKVRLFRVPELLAGSFIISILAVAASYLFSIGAS